MTLSLQTLPVSLSRGNTSMKPNKFAQYTAFSAGLFYLLVTLTMFLNPAWFFENVGHFPPFNRHYMGDNAISQATEVQPIRR